MLPSAYWLAVTRCAPRVSRPHWPRCRAMAARRRGQAPLTGASALVPCSVISGQDCFACSLQVPSPQDCVMYACLGASQPTQSQFSWPRSRDDRKGTTLICHLGKVAQEFGGLAMRAALLEHAEFGGICRDSKRQAALSDPKVTDQGLGTSALPLSLKQHGVRRTPSVRHCRQILLDRSRSPRCSGVDCGAGRSPSDINLL